MDRLYDMTVKGGSSAAKAAGSLKPILDKLQKRKFGPISKKEGTKITKEMRDALQLEKKNIAISQSKIDGVTQTHTSISGSASPEGTVGPPANRTFHYLTMREDGAMTRAFDSEIKILEDLAQKMTKDSTGTLHLFTEKYPCESCIFAIKQFKKRYPKVKVNITSGAEAPAGQKVRL
jgi:hypothetical protein